MNEKQYVFTYEDYITIVVQTNNVPNAWQALKDLGIDISKLHLLTITY